MGYMAMLDVGLGMLDVGMPENARAKDATRNNDRY